jgi:hypothetical protein
LAGDHLVANMPLRFGCTHDHGMTKVQESVYDTIGYMTAPRTSLGLFLMDKVTGLAEASPLAGEATHPSRISLLSQW